MWRDTAAKSLWVHRITSTLPRQAVRNEPSLKSRERLLVYQGLCVREHGHTEARTIDFASSDVPREAQFKCLCCHGRLNGVNAMDGGVSIGFHTPPLDNNTCPPSTYQAPCGGGKCCTRGLISKSGDACGATSIRISLFVGRLQAVPDEVSLQVHREDT